MTPPTDDLAGAHPRLGSSSAADTSPGVESGTSADFDAMDAILDLQVEEVAYQATLQALERPFVAGLRRFLG